MKNIKHYNLFQFALYISFYFKNRKHLQITANGLRAVTLYTHLVFDQIDG